MKTLHLILPVVFCTTTAHADSISWLRTWLREHDLGAAVLSDLQALPESSAPLSAADASAAATELWNARKRVLKAERAAEMKARSITLNGLTMPFWYRTFGEKPATGRSLFISLHGGGGAPARVNDGQYENQKRLYEPAEGVYLVPRAPTNTWNLWHQRHIDAFFDRLITNMIVFEDVDPNRVYVMGYSAGGDGVYQLAPRMADRWAAAAMMAGHPNEARPDNLRNIGFTIHMGAEDGAYNRNRVAAEWKDKLAELRSADSEGYVHKVTLHEGLGHWMKRRDAVAVPWMARFTRNPFPARVVWFQDDVTQKRLYWLAVPEKQRRAGTRVVAEVDGNTISIRESDVTELTVLFSESLVDLDKPVRIRHGESVLYEGKVARTVGVLAESLLHRDDPAAMVPAHVTVNPDTN